MTLVRLATDDDAEIWDNYVFASENAESYHPYEWRKLFERVYGHNCYYYLAEDESGQLCGVLPLVQLNSRLFGNFLVSVPGFNYAGTLADNDVVRELLIASAWDQAKRLGASHIELRHNSNVKISLPFRDDKVAMRLPLPDSCDSLWSGFPSKLRAQIRRPTKEGATCDEGGVELVDDFYKVFSRNMRDLGTPVFPRELFVEMCRSFPETTRVFVVRLDGIACAAGITYGFRERLEIPSASSLREYNRASVNMLLYWTVLQYAIREGYSLFDFGRSTVNEGTFRFKKQWGAEPDPLCWHYRLPDGEEIPRINPQNPKFRLATKLWQKLPVGFANVLGPHIVRNLP